MNDILKTRIKLEIDKAEESLKGAKVLFDSSLFDEAVSSAYYAMFHMAKALVLTAGEEPSTHHGLITIFGLKFVKPNIIEPIYNDILVDAKESREAGDYDAAKKFTKDEAEEKVVNAGKFKERIFNYLKEKGYL